MNAVEDIGPVVTIERRPNPLTSWAQFLHELEAGKPDAGTVDVAVNHSTLTGGFARFYGTDAQREACKRFLDLWERGQVGSTRAIDPSVEPVDGGWCNPEAVIESGLDARMQLEALRTHLGPVDLNRLHFVVVRGWGPTSYARWRWHLRNPNSRAVADAKVEVRRIADKAAAFFKLA